MPSAGSEYKQELFREIQGLSDEKLKEILDFTYFIKAKDAIDPSQAYFWTSNWQAIEREVDRDKEAGNVIGGRNVKWVAKRPQQMKIRAYKRFKRAYRDSPENIY